MTLIYEEVNNVSELYSQTRQEHGDLVSFVASLNLTRRQLTPTDLGIAGAKIKHIFEAEAKKRQRATQLAGKTPDGNYKTSENISRCSPKIAPDETEGRNTNAKAAKMVGSSEASVYRASKVLKSGNDNLIKAVEGNKIKLEPAAVIAQLPKEEQPAALEQALAPKPKEQKKTVKRGCIVLTLRFVKKVLEKPFTFSRFLTLIYERVFK